MNDYVDLDIGELLKGWDKFKDHLQKPEPKDKKEIINITPKIKQLTKGKNEN